MIWPPPSSPNWLRATLLRTHYTLHWLSFSFSSLPCSPSALGLQQSNSFCLEGFAAAAAPTPPSASCDQKAPYHSGLSLDIASLLPFIPQVGCSVLLNHLVILLFPDQSPLVVMTGFSSSPYCECLEGLAGIRGFNISMRVQ